ncbi:unnamed protein product [Clonostachys rosea f. rosea IK726]|uniref:F-box domain-containing protein n=2 Tax=Bionectria ochroleuca TaxID=29856 RepID=A0A0B7JZY7_BIOOC|nr:unnamed protein product [Clonostachys rosea f. rosea IK726]
MSTDTATARALALPEILSEVFAILHGQEDFSSLASAARANSLWFACATDILWSQVKGDAITSIANIADSRRQFYASKVEGITFDGNKRDMPTTDFPGLCFNKIKSIFFNVYWLPQGSAQLIKPYIQPSLESFVFYGEDFVDEILLELHSTCHRLQVLLIDNTEMDFRKPKLTGETLFRLISQTRTLRDLSLCCGGISDELFFCVSGLENLSALSWCVDLTPELLSRTIAQNPNHFLSLDSFSMPYALSSISVSYIATMLPHLTKINLGFGDSEYDVLTSLSTIENLTRLECLFQCNVSFSAPQLLSLKVLSKLTKLSIRIGSDFDRRDTTSPFSDAEFQELISALPGLQCLEMEFACDLTAAALLSLSACPKLDRFSMRRGLRCDLRSLLAQAGEEPLHPHLGTLYLARISTDNTDYTSISARDLACQIIRYFPKLGDFDVEDCDRRDGRVVDEFWNLVAH